MNGKNHMPELTSLVGAHFTAYAAQAKRPGGIGIVTIPVGRGLLPSCIEIADRFATARI